MVCARDNERAFPVEREPTVYFSRAERSAGQHGTCNNTTYSGSQARRRKTKNVRGFQYNSKFFFLSLQPVTIQAVYYHLLSFLT